MNTIRMMGFTVLTLLSILPIAKPTPPVLTTHLFSQSTILSPWTNTILIPQTTMGGCVGSGSTQNTPAIVPAGGMNLTEKLSSRDAGSTLVQFRIAPGTAQTFLFSSKDLTTPVVTELYCDFFTGYAAAILNKMQIWLGGTWRPTESGNYTLYTLEACVNCALTTPFVPTIVANESWTVTTIS